MQSLLLFDIDGTLISTGGVGVLAMQDAGRELFGSHFTIEGVKYAGRLDPLIAADLFAAHGVEETAETRARFRTAYERALRERLRTWDKGGALPGVHSLLDVLFRERPAAMGLLTGNFRETGSVKLRSCGLIPDRFDLAVWGDESPHTPCAREHLPPVALARFRQRYGCDVSPDRVTVIGDTPHDVACAKVNGCHALGVATGKYSVAELLAAGADHAVENLSDTSSVHAWLTRRCRGC